MPHILVVCTANICRSPVVEALIARRLREEERMEWTVSSAGFLADGWAVSSGSLEAAAPLGLDLSGHTSRQITVEMLAAARLVVGMEARHVEALERVPEASGKGIRLAELAGVERDVDDPYGGPREGYEAMVRDVAELVDRGWQRLLERVTPNERAGKSLEGEA